MSARLTDRTAAATAPFLLGLDPEALTDVFASSRAVALKRGGILFRQGDMPTHLYLLLSGRMKAWRVTPSGTPMTVAHLGPGELAACVATFCSVPLPATAVASEPCRLLAWPCDRIVDLAGQHPALGANALQIVGTRTQEMLRRIESLSTERAERRIVSALLRLADGKDAEPIVRVSRQELADLTATTLHTVSRTVSRWERDGLVRGGRERITILDREGLRAL